MGIIDKESAMNLALGVSTTNPSDEESVLLMSLGGIEDNKKELERLRVIYLKFADDLKAIQIRQTGRLWNCKLLNFGHRRRVKLHVLGNRVVILDVAL